MFKTIKSFIKDESGLETVEYAIMLALIAVATVLAIQTLGGSVGKKFGEADTAVNTPALP